MGGWAPRGKHRSLRRIPEGTLDADILEPRSDDKRRKLLRIHEAESARILQLENARRVVQKIAGDGSQVSLVQLGQVSAPISGLQLGEAFHVEPTDVRIPAEGGEDESPTRPEDPMNLGEEELGVFQIADQQGRDHSIDAVVRQRNSLCDVEQVQIRLDRCEPELPPNLVRTQAPTRPVKGLSDVVEGDDVETFRRPTISGEGEWKGSGPGTEVGDAIPGTDAQDLHLPCHHRLIRRACGQELDAERTIPSDEIVAPEGLQIGTGIGPTPPLREPQAPNQARRRRHGQEIPASCHQGDLACDQAKREISLMTRPDLVADRQHDEPPCIGIAARKDVADSSEVHPCVVTTVKPADRYMDRIHVSAGILNERHAVTSRVHRHPVDIDPDAEQLLDPERSPQLVSPDIIDAARNRPRHRL